jgi:hypothetical protein
VEPEIVTEPAFVPTPMALPVADTPVRVSAGPEAEMPTTVLLTVTSVIAVMPVLEIV